MKAIPLYEGSYSVDSSKKFVPFNPQTEDPKSRKGSIFVHVYPFLIETSNELILLDTGLGQMDEEMNEPLLHSNIRKAGYEPSQISKIIMSHLHSDHSMGLVIREGDSFRLSFPEADLYVQRQEMQTSLLDAPSSYPKRQMHYVKEHAKLHLLEGNGHIGPEIYYEHSGGHCPHHQVIHIDAGSDYFFFGGDVMPESATLIHNYIAKYDYDGRKTRDLRIAYGKQAAEEGWICLFYHDFDSRPACRISTHADGSFGLIPSLSEFS